MMAFEFRGGKCFVCGMNNPDGLKLKFKMDPAGMSEARCTFDERHQGYDDMVHGGIIAAVLDDTMAYAIIAKDLLPVTAEMKIRFKKPIRVGEEVILEGKIVKTGSKFIQTEAVAKGLDGELKVRAEGVFAIRVGKRE